MKLFSVLFFAASISASTLLAPLYDMAAQQVINSVKGILEGVKGQLEGDGQVVTVITEFEAALDGLDNQVVVDLIKELPIEQILEGGLTADDLASIFADTTAMDAIDFTALNQEFIANLDPTLLAKFEESMDAMVQASKSIQEVFDSEITLSNFVGVATDVLDAFDQIDDVFGFSSGTVAIVREVMLYVTILTEKGLYFMEHYKDYLYMLEDAVTLTELEFERRIQETLDGICTDKFNAVNLAIDVTKFSGSVVLDNWSEPVKKTADIWNTLVGNVPFVEDWAVSTTNLEDLEEAVQKIVDSIEGSLVEMRILLLPLRNVIDGSVQNMVGC